MCVIGLYQGIGMWVLCERAVALRPAIPLSQSQKVRASPVYVYVCCV
jgi:hypothetical protein